MLVVTTSHSKLLPKTKTPKPVNVPAVAIAITLVTLGLVMSFVQEIMQAPLYIQASLTPTKKPARPDFAQYDQLLKTFAKGGRVDYSQLKQSPLLAAAMAELAGNSPENFKSLDDTISYWLNAHNLIAIKVVCDEYPVTMPLKLKREFIDRRFVVGGKALSAEAIYSDYIHPKLIEKRKDKAVQADTIMLLCRGAIGYPEITDHAITAETLRADVASNTDKFVHNKTNVDYQPSEHFFAISKFFQMYRDVFGQGFEDPWAFAIYYLDRLDQVPYEPRLTKTFIQTFNWSINDTSH